MSRRVLEYWVLLIIFRLILGGHPHWFMCINHYSCLFWLIILLPFAYLTLRLLLNINFYFNHNCTAICTFLHLPSLRNSFLKNDYILDYKMVKRSFRSELRHKLFTERLISYDLRNPRSFYHRILTETTYIFQPHHTLKHKSFSLLRYIEYRSLYRLNIYFLHGVRKVVTSRITKNA